MSYFLHIYAVQPPFDIGVDDNDRVTYSCNYDTLVYTPNGPIEKKIADIIVAAGIATQAKCLKGSRPITPPPTSGAIQGTETDGPWIRIVATGGYRTEISRSAERGEKPSFQVLTYSVDSDTASTAALQVYRLLDGLQQRTV